MAPHPRHHRPSREEVRLTSKRKTESVPPVIPPAGNAYFEKKPQRTCTATAAHQQGPRAVAVRQHPCASTNEKGPNRCSWDLSRNT